MDTVPRILPSRVSQGQVDYTHTGFSPMATSQTSGTRSAAIMRSFDLSHPAQMQPPSPLPRRLLGFVLSLVCLAVGRAADAPNFIFILADDLGWTSLSQRMDDRVPGSRSDYHETPSLERLARGGMRFTQGYAPDALCCPTRRSIQFGQTPTRQGAGDRAIATVGRQQIRN